MKCWIIARCSASCWNFGCDQIELPRDEDVWSFQATFRVARVGPWRSSMLGSTNYRGRCLRWNTRWRATSDWSWVCFSRLSTRRERAPALRWCLELRRQLARGRAIVHPRWFKDRQVSRSHRRSLWAMEMGRSNLARRMACSGKNEVNEIPRVKFLAILQFWS